MWSGQPEGAGGNHHHCFQAPLLGLGSGRAGSDSTQRARHSTLLILRSHTLKAGQGHPASRLWREWNKPPDLEVSSINPLPLGMKGFPSSRNTQCFLSQGQRSSLCHLGRETGSP